MGNIEIKKSEIIFSIIIIAVMMILGFSISEKIRQNLLEQYMEYDTAVKIDSEELFLHGMSTNIGNAFVYGNLKALDPVSLPEIDGEYSYIRKEEQEYRKHYRWVKYKDKDGKEKKRKEEYWTWDTMRTYKEKSTRISFLNVEFEYEQIPFPSNHYLDTIYHGYYHRNVYYVTDTAFTGTIFTYLKDDTISKTSFYENRTISETVDYLESGIELVLFWIGWIILTAIAVVGFYYAENKWLN